MCWTLASNFLYTYLISRLGSRWQQNPIYGAYPEHGFGVATDLVVIEFDVRREPRRTIPANVYNTLGSKYAIAGPQPATRIRLISKHMPWTIDIAHGRVFGVDSEVPITCEYLWNKLYQALQMPIEPGEWALIATKDEEKAEAMKAAAKSRAQEGGDAALKRIDYLGKHTMFRGLKKDETLEQKMLLPGNGNSSQTWVVKFGPVREV
jgi:hypothetical protein